MSQGVLIIWAHARVKHDWVVENAGFAPDRCRFRRRWVGAENKDAAGGPRAK